MPHTLDTFLGGYMLDEATVYNEPKEGGISGEAVLGEAYRVLNL